MDASSLLQSYSVRKGEILYRALLVGQYGSTHYPNEVKQRESIKELCLLANTAHIQHSQQIFFRILAPNPKIFFTKGLLEKIRKILMEKQFNVLIVDTDLKPRQLRNLEEEFKMRVLGRIELILDIFAMRAKTKSSSLQVELAQLNYILPRLKGLGGVLSRLGGGIGTRGPGETMLETDRRHIRRRIQKIKKDLKGVSKHRDNLRKNRTIPTFALVGYTNAGKTTLLNQLASSHKKLFTENRLFATLDPFSRKVYLGEIDYKPVYAILTDTVGFIRNLPATLVMAFHSTLEEICYTEIVIVVLDVSSQNQSDELEVVEKELKKIGVENKKKIFFFNKSDLMVEEELKKSISSEKNIVYGNALSKQGVHSLRKKMFEIIKNDHCHGTWTY